MTGVGRGAGEPPEAAWSRLGPRGLVLQYASLPARQSQLERAGVQHNLLKRNGLPNLLGRMRARAQQGVATHSARAMELLQEAESQGFSRSDMNQVRQPVTIALSSVSHRQCEPTH